MSGEMTEYLKNHLEKNLGKTGGEIFNKSMEKKPLDDNSSLGDVCEFIETVEKSMSVLYGKPKSHEVCTNLRKYAKTVFEDAGIPTGKAAAKQKIEPGKVTGLESEITKFLKENQLPTETDISDFAKYLVISGYAGDEMQLTQQITDIVKQKIKFMIQNKKIDNEVKQFLDRFQSPTENDISDFKNYLKMMNFQFDEASIMTIIEKERLYKKFKAPREVTEEEEAQQKVFSEFQKIVESSADAKALGKAMESHNLGYLVKDSESDVYSDSNLADIIEMAVGDEAGLKDALSSMGLSHMIRGK